MGCKHKKYILLEWESKRKKNSKEEREIYIYIYIYIKFDYVAYDILLGFI